MKRAGRREDHVLHGKLVAGLDEHVVEVAPRGGVGGARVAVVHGDGGGFLAALVLLGRLVGHRAHQVDDRVHGDDVAYRVGVDVDCPVLCKALIQHCFRGGLQGLRKKDKADNLGES